MQCNTLYHKISSYIITRYIRYVLYHITLTIMISISITNMVTRWEEKEGYHYTIM